MTAALLQFSTGLKSALREDDGHWPSAGRHAPPRSGTAAGSGRSINPLSPPQDSEAERDRGLRLLLSRRDEGSVETERGGFGRRRPPLASPPCSSPAARTVVAGTVRPPLQVAVSAPEPIPAAAAASSPRQSSTAALLTPQLRSPLTPSFIFDEFDPHIYEHMTMPDFLIGDEAEGETSIVAEVEEMAETDAVLQQKRATVREAHEVFVSVFGAGPLGELRTAIAPGRVNLIGEHVDYCDGFVLSMAIPLYTAAMGRISPDVNRGYTEIHSVHYNETVRIKLPYAPGKEGYPQWARYVQGVLAMYEPVEGMCFDLIVHSHIPPGSSLSSSAALELSVLYLLMEFVDESKRLSKKDAALICQKAEQVYAGCPCGIMDQLAIAAARNQRAIKIDCLTLEYEAIPMSIAHDVVFVVTNTGVKDALAPTENAKRRLDVNRAVKLIGANSWRDVNQELLKQRSASLTGDGGLILARATHVVEEIARTVEAANALLDNNILLFGRLMTASHESLKQKYAVSCAELDALVDIALSVEGVFGARMTGGGFGGCTVSMVRRDAVGKLKDEIKSRYTGGSPSFVECEPVGGVRPFFLDFLTQASQ